METHERNRHFVGSVQIRKRIVFEMLFVFKSLGSRYIKLGPLKINFRSIVDYLSRNNVRPEREGGCESDCDLAIRKRQNVTMIERPYLISNRG